MKSPAQKQHEKLKAAHPEFVHFFRVGDFIQLYGDDAGVAVRVIGCVPVTRKDDDGEHLMTGFPADQLEKCLRKMIAAGHKCAVCDPAA